MKRIAIRPSSLALPTWSLALLAALALASMASGCKGNSVCKGASCTDAGIPTGGPGQLLISPDMVQMTVVGGSQQQQFEAYIDGKRVTEIVTWVLTDKSVGQITSKGLFTTFYPLPHGGPVSIQATTGANAQYGNKVGVAEVQINYVTPDVVEKGAAPNAPTAFQNTVPWNDAKETPQIVYPLDGVMLARNINQLNFQWLAGPTANLFRVHVVGTNIDSSFYVGTGACTPTDNGQGQQCSFQPADAAWQTVAISAAHAAATGGQVSVTVSATVGVGSPVADSSSIGLNLSPDDIRGGLYYFSPAINGIKRLPFGSTTATDFIKNGSGLVCAGCHAVSRDGKKVAATFYGGDGTGGVVAGDNGQKFLVRPGAASGNAVKRWNFATFSPDGALLLTSWAGVLTLRDGTTGAKKFDVQPNITGGQAVMPEWSPDGKSVVFVQVPPEGKLGKDFANTALVAGDWLIGNSGNIATMKFDAGEFMPATVVVPSVMGSEYHYFPSWSPQSDWILFVTARYPGSSPTAGPNLYGYVGATPPKGYVMSYDQDSARLRLVQAEGGAPIELTNATHQGNKTTSWPKFAPFEQNGGSLVFFTFGAKFDYGFIVQNDAQKDSNSKTPQLWMSGIDLKRAAMEFGSDPSYPPFWLPFQSPKEKNHSGIWTQEIACVTNDDCGSEFTCMQGTCQMVNPG